MPATVILLHLAGFVALLLWGMHMVHSGIVRAFGGNLRQVLAIGLKNRWKAFLAGVGITALLQSSTATALMSTSFIAAGFMTLVPALAVTSGRQCGHDSDRAGAHIQRGVPGAGFSVGGTDCVQQGRQDAHARSGPRRHRRRPDSAGAASHHCHHRAGGEGQGPARVVRYAVQRSHHRCGDCSFADVGSLLAWRWCSSS